MKKKKLKLTFLCIFWLFLHANVVRTFKASLPECQPYGYAIIKNTINENSLQILPKLQKRAKFNGKWTIKVQNELLVLLKASLENESQPEPCALLINQHMIIEIALKTFAKPQKMAKLNRKWTVKVQNEIKEVKNGLCWHSLAFSANG